MPTLLLFERSNNRADFALVSSCRRDNSFMKKKIRIKSASLGPLRTFSGPFYEL